MVVYTRGDSYDFIEVEKKETKRQIKQILPDCEVISHNGEDFRYPIFGYEWDIFQTIINEDSIMMEDKISSLIRKLKFIKLKPRERLLVLYVLETMIRMLDSLLIDEHDIPYSDYYNMEKYLEYLCKSSNIFPRF